MPTDPPLILRFAVIAVALVVLYATFYKDKE
jgi:hypothetical protein